MDRDSNRNQLLSAGFLSLPLHTHDRNRWRRVSKALGNSFLSAPGRHAQRKDIFPDIYLWTPAAQIKSMWWSNPTASTESNTRCRLGCSRKVLSGNCHHTGL